MLVMIMLQKKHLLYLFLSIIILNSCKKEGIYYVGWSNALKNNLEWEGEIYSYQSPRHSDRIDIFLNEFNQQGFLRGSLDIYRIPNEVGKYELQSNDDSVSYSIFFTLLDDGDVLGSAYLLNDNEDNFVEIERKKGDKVWGNFQVTYYLENGSDTLVFTNGQFKTKILDID